MPKRILTILLSIALIFSCAMLFSCDSCEGAELPANLASYQELLNKYKPSEEDLAKSLGDFGEDGYAIYKRAYYQLLLCDQYSIAVSGATETLGVSVRIDNLKKRDGNHYYMRTVSTGSSGLFGGMTDNDIETYIDIRNGYVKTQNNKKNDGYNGVEQALDDYLSRWGVLQYALCNYVIDETTVQSAEVVRQDGKTLLVITLDPVPASVNQVKQTRMMSGTAADYNGGEIVYTVEIDDAFTIRSVNVKERYKAMGFTCKSEITDTYSYAKESGFSAMAKSERYTYSGNASQEPIAPVYDASYLLTSLAQLGAGSDAAVTLRYGETTQEFRVSFTLEPLAVQISTEIFGKPVRLDLRGEDGTYDLFVALDGLTLHAEAASLAEILSDYADLFGFGGNLGDSLTALVSDIQLTALKKLTALTGEKTADGIVYQMALSAFAADADGELSAVIGEDGGVRSLSLTDLAAGDTAIGLEIHDLAPVSDLWPVDKAKAVDAAALLKRIEPFIAEKALSFRTELFGLEATVNADFSGETPVVRADLSGEELPAPVSVWLSDRLYLTMGEFAISAEYEDLASIAELFGLSLELPAVPDEFDLEELLSALSVSNEGNLIALALGETSVLIDAESLDIAVPAFDLQLSGLTAGADAALPALDWQKAGDVLPVVRALAEYIECGKFDVKARILLEESELTAEGRLSIADGDFTAAGTVGAFGETFAVWYGGDRLCIGWNQIKASVQPGAIAALLPALPELPALDFSALEALRLEENKITAVVAGTEISVSLDGERLNCSVGQILFAEVSLGAFDSIEAPAGYADLTQAIVGLDYAKLQEVAEAGIVSFAAALGDYRADVTVALDPLSVCAALTVGDTPVVLCYREGMIELVAGDYAVSLTPDDLTALLADFGISADGFDFDPAAAIADLAILSAEGTAVTVEIAGIPVTIDTATFDLVLAETLFVSDVAAGRRVAFPDREFVYIGKSLSLAAPALEILNAGGVTLNGRVSVGETEIGVAAELSFADGFAIGGTLTAGDLPIAFTYCGGMVYCSVANINARLDPAAVLELLGIGGAEIDLRSLIGAITAGEDWLGVELAGIPVVVRKTAGGLNLSADGLCSFDATAGCGEIAAPTGYADLTEAITSCDFATIFDIVGEERVAVTATAAGYTAEITVAFRPLSVKATTVIEGIGLELYYENGVFSLRAGDLALYLTDEEIVSLVEELVGIDLGGLSQISPVLALYLIENVTADGTRVAFEALGIPITVDTQALTVTVADAAAIKIKGAGDAFSVPALGAQPAAKLLPMIRTAAALAESGKLTLNGALDLDGVSVRLQNWNLSFGEDGIRSAAGAIDAFGQTVSVTYVSEKFYFELAKIRVSAGLAYVKVFLRNAGISLDVSSLTPADLLAKLSGLQIEDGAIAFVYDGISVRAAFGEQDVSLTVGGVGTVTAAIGDFREPTVPIGYQDGGIFLMQLNTALFASLGENRIGADVKIGENTGKIAVSFGEKRAICELGESGITLWYENGRLYLAAGNLALSAAPAEWLRLFGADAALEIDPAELLAQIGVYFEGSVLCVKVDGTVVKVNAADLAVSVPAWNLTVRNYAPAKDWKRPALDWQNLDRLIPAVREAMRIAETGSVALNGAVTAGEGSLTVNRLALFWDETGIYAFDLNASYNGTECAVVYTDGMLYLECDGWKFSASGESLLTAAVGILASGAIELPAFDLTAFDPLEAIRSLTVGDAEATLVLLLGGEEIAVTLQYGTGLSLAVDFSAATAFLRTEGEAPVLPAPFEGCIDLSDVLLGFDYGALSLLTGELSATAAGTVGNTEFMAELGIAPAAGAVSADLMIGGAELFWRFENGELFFALGGAYSRIEAAELMRYVAIFTGEVDFLAELKDTLKTDGTVLSFSVRGVEIAADAASLSLAVSADGLRMDASDLRAGSCRQLPAGEYRSLNGLSPLIASVYEGYRANRFTADGSLVLAGQTVNIDGVKVKVDNANAQEEYQWTDATKAFDEGRLPLTGRISFPTADRTHLLDITYAQKTLYLAYSDNGSDFTRLSLSRESLDGVVDVIKRNQSDLINVLGILGVDLSKLGGDFGDLSLAGAVQSLRLLSAEENALTVALDGAFMGLNGEYALTVALNDDGTIGLSLEGSDYSGALTIGFSSDFAVAAPGEAYIDASELSRLVDGLIITVKKESRQFYFEGTVKMKFLTVDVNVKLTASMRITEDNKLDAYVTWDSSRPVGEEITTIFNSPTGLTYQVHTDYLAYGKSALTYTYDSDRGDSAIMVARMNQKADYYETGKLIKVKHYYYADGAYEYKKAYVAELDAGIVDVTDIIILFTGLNPSLFEDSSSGQVSYAKILTGYGYAGGVHTVKADVGELAGTSMLGVATVTLAQDDAGYLTDTSVVLPVKFIGLNMLNITLDATHIVDRTVNAEMDAYLAEAKSRTYGSFPSAA